MDPALAQKRLRRVQEKVAVLEKLIEDKSRELYQASEALRQAHDYLEKVVDSMLSSLIVTDEQAAIKTVNRATLELLGYQEKELLGRSLAEVCSFSALDAAEGPEDLMRIGQLVRQRAAYRTRQGDFIPVLFSSSAMRDSEDRIAGLVCIAQDMSEQVKVEEALRRAEEKFRTIFENAVEGIFQTAPEGRYLSANPALARIHGYDSVEAMLAEVADIANQFYLDPNRRAEFIRQIEEHGFVAGFESPFRRRDGSLGWIRENARAVRDAKGRTLYYEGTVEDITQRKQVEAQLMQSDKMASIGSLAAGVAHEINNPMGFISSNLGTLGEYVRDLSSLLASYAELEERVAQGELEKAREILQSIQQQKEELDLQFLLEDVGNLIGESREGAERVRRIVQNLKEFSHIDKEEKALANLNEGLESTLNIVWNELKYKATVTKDYGDLPEVPCYPQELNQVFMNLLVNAAQAIEEKGTIAIRTYQDDGHLCVEIADTGKGMPLQVQKRIFEPFFTTKPVGKGTGLGLTMAYNIVVDKHGGQILVDSKEGVGTTFTIRIPLRP